MKFSLIECNKCLRIFPIRTENKMFITQCPPCRKTTNTGRGSMNNLLSVLFGKNDPLLLARLKTENKLKRLCKKIKRIKNV